MIRQATYFRAFATYQPEESVRLLGDLTLTSGGVTVHIDEISVLRETPSGVWVKNHSGGETWVHNNPIRKAYAYSTKEKALESLKIRNLRRCEILRFQLDGATAIKKAIASDDYDSVTLKDGQYPMHEAAE